MSERPPGHRILFESVGMLERGRRMLERRVCHCLVHSQLVESIQECYGPMLSDEAFHANMQNVSVQVFSCLFPF